MRAQERERAHRIGAAPLVGGTPFRRERLRQDEQTVDRVREAEGRRRPKRKPWIETAEDAAEGRADHEADAEGSTEKAVARRAPVRLGYIGNVGERRGNARRCNAGDHASDEEP